MRDESYYHSGQYPCEVCDGPMQPVGEVYKENDSFLVRYACPTCGYFEVLSGEPGSQDIEEKGMSASQAGYLQRELQEGVSMFFPVAGHADNIPRAVFQDITDEVMRDNPKLTEAMANAVARRRFVLGSY